MDEDVEAASAKVHGLPASGQTCSRRSRASEISQIKCHRYCNSIEELNAKDSIGANTAAGEVTSSNLHPLHVNSESDGSLPDIRAFTPIIYDAQHEALPATRSQALTGKFTASSDASLLQCNGKPNGDLATMTTTTRLSNVVRQSDNFVIDTNEQRGVRANSAHGPADAEEESRGR